MMLTMMRTMMALIMMQTMMMLVMTMPRLLCTAGARKGNGRFRDLSNQTWGNPSKMWGGLENEKNI